MKNIIRNLVVLCLMLMLIACGDSDSKNKSDSQKVYDYRDEHNQDFYSRYMRNTKQDSLSIDSQAIREKLGLSNVPDRVLGQLNVYRTDPNDKINSPINQLKNRAEILAFYNRKDEKFEQCDARDQKEHFFCIEDKKKEAFSREYYYIPSESIKLKHIDQVMRMNCTVISSRESCKIINRLDYPYNTRLTIYFTDSQNFFYLIPYIEQHFYETTGDHVWQILPNQN